MPTFSIRIAGDDIGFSAAHFITLPAGECEPLHGHNFQVVAELDGPLDEQQCVLDFVAVRKLLKAILAEFDHRVLLPSRHQEMRVVSASREVEVTFGDLRWVFPKSGCAVLPLPNTTAELLAKQIAQRLGAELRGHFKESLNLTRLRVEVGEGTGFSAGCELTGAELP